MMLVNFNCYLIDREYGGILRLLESKITDDIEQSKIDLMLELTDYEWYCVKVKLISIEYFVIGHNS